MTFTYDAGYQRTVEVLHEALCGRWPHDRAEACANANEAHRLTEALANAGLLGSHPVELGSSGHYTLTKPPPKPPAAYRPEDDMGDDPDGDADPWA